MTAADRLGWANPTGFGPDDSDGLPLPRLRIHQGSGPGADSDKGWIGRGWGGAGVMVPRRCGSGRGKQDGAGWAQEPLPAPFAAI